ncbi:MAG: periplasmic heavy metal sensor [Roseovarius sp.]
MSDRTDQPGRAGAPRWMKILLVVSLALNLLVLGLMAGFAIKGGPKWRGGPPGGMGAMHRALAEEDREMLKRRMTEMFRAQPDGREAFRQEMAAIVALLRADRFDAAAASETMARVRGVFDDRIGSAQALLIDHWAQMPAEARAAYADRLEAELKRRKR